MMHESSAENAGLEVGVSGDQNIDGTKPLSAVSFHKAAY
jgi:hypothetical protein